MIEFIKEYYVEIAIVIVVIFLFTKVKRIMRKAVGIVFAVATIARLYMMLSGK